MQSWTIKLAAAIACLFLGAGMSAAFLSGRPDTLSFEYRSHSLAPSVKRVVVNGSVMGDYSLGNRSTTGGASWRGMFSWDIEIELYWYDILTKSYYQKVVTVDGHDVSTFGEAGDHASLRVVVGPGADIKVDTSHPEQLRLIGLGRSEEITPELDVRVPLLEACADPLPATDEIAVRLREVAEMSSLDRVMELRQNAISHGTSGVSRCNGAG